MNTYTPDEHAAGRRDAGRRDDGRMDAWNAAPAPMAAASPERTVGVGVDARKLWAGGAASALVAGLVALVGVLVSRWLFKVPLLAPRQDGAFGNVHTVTLVLVVIGAALLATGLMQVLMLGTLRPRLFFGWIVGLVTAIMVVFPFGTTAPLDAKIATAVVNLVIGVAIGTLVGGVAARAVAQPSRAPADPYRYDRGR
jgi:Family of unknown function (DUF6069)